MHNGKTAIVTGAASGIGRATALAFAREGAKVCLADVDEAGLLETRESIRQQRGEALAAPVDVTRFESCREMVALAEREFGSVDVIFNNAGVMGPRDLIAELSVADWQKVIDINLNGVFYCTRAALPALVKTGSGVVINNSSCAGLVGMGGESAYSASKHAVIGLTKTTALEYSRKGIRCVAIAPGNIATPMNETLFSTEEKDAYNQSLVPQGRAAAPEEVAEFVVWLAADKASYVNGAALQVDGGMLAGVGIIP